MRCGNIFCIYWNDNECSLDSISLDVQGICEECIYVDIDKAELKRHRDDLLIKYGLKQQLP